MSRYKYFQDVINTATGTPFKGFPSTNLQSLLTTNNDITFKIPLNFQYRPDLISNYFYGDPTLYWVLIYRNNITNSPEGFETDTSILIPYINKVLQL